MTYSPLAVAAFHEAGHVIANLNFGIAIRCVWVKRDGSGMCVRYCASGVPFMELVSAWAGPYAERELTGLPLYLGGDRDVTEANAAVVSFPYVMKASYRARDLVRERWPSIVTIAAVLVAERRLDGETVERLADMTNSKRAFRRAH